MALHADREELVNRDLLGTISADERSQLSEIEREISRWTPKESPTRNAAIWDRMDALAARSMAIQARIERLKRG
jgi:hypothetical protein